MKRLALVALALGTVGAATALAGSSPPVPDDVLLPDLVADQAEQPRYEIEGEGKNRRLLVRFNGYVHNVGDGALEVFGSQRTGLQMKGVQRLYRADGTFVEHVQPTNPPDLYYETDDGHNHWHVHDVARYTLVTEDGTTPVTAAPKAGFCLIDTERRESNGPLGRAYESFCGNEQPMAANVLQGVSAGWRDLYDGDLQFQFLNASWTPPGRYRIRTEIDPDDRFVEANEINPPTVTDRIVPVPGYGARPVTVRTERDRPATIRLRSQRFGATGPRRFRITSTPRNGRLNRRAGKNFAAGRVVYTPKPGFTGRDSFSYIAKDVFSPFPRVNVLATVSIWVGPGPAPRVAIGGVASRVRVGTGMQLTRATRGLPSSRVRWSVNGIPGGNSTVGTISGAGVYAAPAKLPRRRVVRIRATSVHDRTAFAQRPVKLVSPERLLQADLVLKKPRVAVRGRALVTTTVSGARRGTLRFTARAGSRTLRGCAQRVQRFREQSCSIPLPRGVPATSVRLTAIVTQGRLVLARRTYALPR